MNVDDSGVEPPRPGTLLIPPRGPPPSFPPPKTKPPPAPPPAPAADPPLCMAGGPVAVVVLASGADVGVTAPPTRPGAARADGANAAVAPSLDVAQADDPPLLRTELLEGRSGPAVLLVGLVELLGRGRRSLVAIDGIRAPQLGGPKAAAVVDAEAAGDGRHPRPERAVGGVPLPGRPGP